MVVQRCLIAAAILVLSFASMGKANPRISEIHVACADGFCVEMLGDDLLASGPIKSDKVGRYQNSYVNIYRGDNKKERIGRIYRHQFIDEASSKLGDAIVVDLRSPVLERAMVRDGLHFQVINPKSTGESKATDRHKLTWDQNPVVLCTGFDDHKEGQYRNRQLKQDFFGMGPDRGWRRGVATKLSRIERPSPNLPGSYRNDNKVLVVTNGAGQWGPLGTADGVSVGGGLTFSALICQNGDCDSDGLEGAFTRSRGFEELFMSYWIRFEGADGGDFDFRRGGKLPGFAGGQTAVASGGGLNGVRPDGRNGWSARATFASSGRAHQYLYYPENSNDLVGDRQYGENRTWMLNGEEFRFDSNRWYRILQRVRMNSVETTSGKGRRDGIIQVWVDDALVLDEQELRFRDAPSKSHRPDEPPYHVGKPLDIDTIAWGLFHGGGTPGHAPLKDVRYELDDFLVFEPRRGVKSDASCN